MNSDRNAAGIVSALRHAGAFCAFLDPEGGGGRGGLPDLLVAHPRVGTRLIEVKAPRGRLNAAQQEWHTRWQAAGGTPVVVVRSIVEALAAIGLNVEFREQPGHDDGDVGCTP